MFIQIVVFSFDRAIQLDRLLSSIIAHWKSPNYEVDILYNSSTHNFQCGYDLLINKFSIFSNITFHKEAPSTNHYHLRDILSFFNLKRLIKYPYLRHPKTDFRPKLLQILKESPTEFVTFLTDDSEFIDNVNISKKEFSWLNECPFQRQYSLRTGKGMDNYPSSSIIEKNNTLTWNFYECPHLSNWGYPFSVDAHIYKKNNLLKILKRIIFSNTNSLEGFVKHFTYKKKLFGQGKSGITPYIISYPINMVQSVSKNESLCISADLLNDYYLKGFTISYSKPNLFSRFQYYPDKVFLTKEDKIVIINTASMKNH